MLKSRIYKLDFIKKTSILFLINLIAFCGYNQIDSLKGAINGIEFRSISKLPSEQCLIFTDFINVLTFKEKGIEISVDNPEILIEYEDSVYYLHTKEILESFSITIFKVDGEKRRYINTIEFQPCEPIIPDIYINAYKIQDYLDHIASLDDNTEIYYSDANLINLTSKYELSSPLRNASITIRSFVIKDANNEIIKIKGNYIYLEKLQHLHSPYISEITIGLFYRNITQDVNVPLDYWIKLFRVGNHE